MTTINSSRKLTVAMIVRDAAEILGDSIKSVQKIADEIIVLDTGSEDNTVEIAKSMATKVVQSRWNDSFSLARNEALTHATGDAVLWLDAGEVIHDQDAKDLRKFIEEKMDMTTAYVMVVKIPQEEGNIGSEQIGKIRLLPNNPGIQFSGRVRENPLYSLAQCDMNLAAVPYSIYRTRREHLPSVKMSKAARNVQLIDREIKEGEPNARLLICMAEAMQALNDQANALAFYQQACQLAEHGSTEQLESLYGILTSLDGQTGCLEMQIKTCVTALEIFPLDAQLLCAMGGYLQTKGQLQLAQRSFETAYQYGQINPETWHIEDIDQIAASCYVLTTQLLGEQERAEEILLSAMNDFPSSVRLRRQLIEMYIKLGKRDAAIAEVKKLPQDYPNVEAYRSAVRGAVAAVQQNWVAARPYLEAAYRRGCRETICLRWYCLTLISLGHQNQAKEIIEVWQQHDLHSLEPKQMLQMMDQNQQQPIEQQPDRTIRVDQKDHGKVSGIKSPSDAAKKNSFT